MEQWCARSGFHSCSHTSQASFIHLAPKQGFAGAAVALEILYLCASRCSCVNAQPRQQTSTLRHHQIYRPGTFCRSAGAAHPTNPMRESSRTLCAAVLLARSAHRWTATTRLASCTWAMPSPAGSRLLSMLTDKQSPKLSPWLHFGQLSKLQRTSGSGNGDQWGGTWPGTVRLQAK